MSQHQPGFPQGPMPPPPNPQKRNARAVIVGLIAGFLGLMIGGGCGAVVGSSGNDTSSDAAPTVTVTETVKEDAPKPDKAAEDKPTEKAKPKPKPKPKVPTVSGDGEYLVGTEMQAGTWKTEGPASFGCYWERNKDASGEFNSIISNGNPNGTARVTVNKGEVFKSQGCKEWKKVG